MTAHFDEEAQAEQLKQWWKDNWMALAAGLVLGIGAIFGWEGWKSYQEQRAGQASQMFEELKTALAESKTEEAMKLGDALAREHADTPYAAGAALFLAAEAVRANDFDQALSRLQWATQYSKDEGLRQVARLRQARVLWQQDKADAALKLLEGDNGGFEAMAEELRGDIRLAQGDRAAARAAYEKALAAVSDEDPATRTSLQRKLEDLTDVVQS